MPPSDSRLPPSGISLNPARSSVFLSQTLKQFFMPNPLNCLQALHNLLPILAREMNSKLLDELADAVKRLNSEPSSVEEFVDFVKFHTKVTTRMETLEVEFENVKVRRTTCAME